MNKFDSRARFRFASIRKRRAFGPRKDTRPIGFRRGWRKIRGKRGTLPALCTMEIVRWEGFRFITSPLLPEERTDSTDAFAYMIASRRGKSTFADEWKYQTIAAEVAGRLADSANELTDNAMLANVPRAEEFTRAMWDAIQTGTGVVKP